MRKWRVLLKSGESTVEREPESEEELRQVPGGELADMTEEEMGRLKPRTVVYSTLLDPKAKVGDLQHCEHSGSNLGEAISEKPKKPLITIQLYH